MRRSLQLMAVAATIAALSDRVIPIGELTADLRTATGERKTFRLDDGSELVLNARSAVDLDFDERERRLHLRSGSGFVRIARDPRRPFTAISHDCLVRPQGNSLMLASTDLQGEVLAIRSAVEISNRSASLLVPAGSAARFDALTLGPLRQLSGGENAWIDGFIEARNLSLEQVAHALRPYRAGVLQLHENVSRLRVSGRFPLDDSDLALAALAQVLPIKLHWRTPLWVTLEPA